MMYLEGIDYFVHPVEFPNQAAGGCAVSNGDGTFTVYINTRCSAERQVHALRHELEHLEKNHFFRDAPIRTIEDEANGNRLPDVLTQCPSGTIPLFHSLDSFKHYLVSFCDQRRQGAG